MVSAKKRKPTLELGFVPFYGLFGIFEMILSLTNQIFHHFCRLSHWLPTRSICGLLSNRRSTAKTWILGATVRQRLLGIYTADSGGDLTKDWHIEILPRFVMMYF
jgi:hypothetical protein